MADRVHPAPPPPPLSSPSHPPPPPPPPTDDETHLHPHPTFARPAAPPAGTYIVQVPKDQILRIPPPDRARRYKHLSASVPARRRLLRRACCCLLASALLLLLLAASFAAALYLIYRPRAPEFSVSSLSIHGLLNSSSAAGTLLSPRLNATVRADNSRNRKVAVEYRGGGTVAVFYSSSTSSSGETDDVRLAEGEWPELRQGARSVTEVAVAMEGGGVRLTEEEAAAMEKEQKASAVPMVVVAEVPVRLWFGRVVRTWTVRVRARCGVSVERVDGDAGAVVNRGCRVKVKPLWWWW